MAGGYRPLFMSDPIAIRHLSGRRAGHKLRRGKSALIEELPYRVSVPDAGPIEATGLFGAGQRAAPGYFISARTALAMSV